MASEGDHGHARVFSIEEANSLVPELTRVVERQLDLGNRIQAHVAELYEHAPPQRNASGADVVDITVHPGDTAHVRELKRTLATLIASYRSGWREIEELGAVIKDTRSGLLDLYGRVDDRLVWLCWKYPEPSIDYYHELDAGYAGRKPLADVRARLLN